MSHSDDATLTLQTLQDLLGDDEETIREVLDAYAQDLFENCAALAEAASARDRPRYGRVAHTMTGASANVGADAFAALCASAEKRSATAPWDELDGLAREVAAVGQRLRAIVQDRARGAAAA